MNTQQQQVGRSKEVAEMLSRRANEHMPQIGDTEFHRLMIGAMATLIREMDSMSYRLKQVMDALPVKKIF